MKYFAILLLFSACFWSHPLQAQWERTNGPFRGNANFLLEINNQIWAASSSGGIFVSSDQGRNWRRLQSFSAGAEVFKVKQFGTEILMVGTEKDSFTLATKFMFYRSTDLGQSWVKSALPNLGYLSQSAQIGRSSTKTYVSTSNALFSSDNLGQSWSGVALPPGPNATAFAINGDSIVVALSNGIARSTNGGVSWSPIDLFTPYKAFLEGSLLITGYKSPDSLRVSSDFGQSWTAVDNNGINPERIKRGKNGLLYEYTNNYIHTSADNGLSWTTYATSTYLPASDHIQVGARFLISASNGLFLTTTNNSAWESVSGGGFTGLSLNRLKTDGNGKQYAATNTSLFRSDNYGFSWKEITLPTGSFPLKFVVKNDTIVIWNSYQVQRSTDLGLSWQSISTTIPNGLLAAVEDLEWLNNTIYILDSGKIYASDNQGQSWTVIDNTSSSETAHQLLWVNNSLYKVAANGKVTMRDINGTWQPRLNINQGYNKFDYRLLYHQNRLFVFGEVSYYSDFPHAGSSWKPLSVEGLPKDAQGNIPQISSATSLEQALIIAIPQWGLFISTDNGITWNPFFDDNEQKFATELICDGKQIMASAESGSLWRRGVQVYVGLGEVYWDVNKNGQHEPGSEPLLSSVMLKSSPADYLTTTNALGKYTTVAFSTSDTIRPILPKYSHAVPPFVTYGNDGTSSFPPMGLQFEADSTDLCISATVVQPFRPGFSTTLHMTIKNVGTTAAPAKVILHINSDVYFVNASQPGSMDADTITWDLGIIPPFGVRTITVDLKASTGLMNGDYVSLICTVVTDNDIDLINNSESLREIVVASYDPNDKQVREGDKITPDALAQGQRLTYTVRFQNTGTYYAEFVVIRDTLTANTDPASLQVLGSSHPCTWSLTGSGVLSFRFDSIFLVPQSESEALSQGFITFSVAPRRGLVLGDAIDNTADIYFDYNPPIRTNTVTTTVSLPTLAQSANSGRLSVYPNPTADGLLHVQWPKLSGATQITALQLYDVNGKLLFEDFSNKAVYADGISIQLPPLKSGLYFIRLNRGGRWETVQVELLK